jgi:hypothetical protein
MGHLVAGRPRGKTREIASRDRTGGTRPLAERLVRRLVAGDRPEPARQAQHRRGRAELGELLVGIALPAERRGIERDHRSGPPSRYGLGRQRRSSLSTSFVPL